MFFDIHCENIDCYLIVSAFRYDKIGISLARLYKLQMHRLQNTRAALHYRLGRAAKLYDIALDDADKAFVRVCVNKDSEVHHVAQLLVT